MAGPWEKYAAAPQAESGPWAKYQTAEPAKKETSILDDIKQGAGDLLAGAVRGAGSIGSTILAPYDMAKDALAGKGLSLDSNMQRRADIDAGLQTMGAQPDSLLYKGGKLGAEIAGTAGAGGLVANGLRVAAPGVIAASPRVAQLVEAIASSGLRTGAPAAATFGGQTANMLTRMAGGGISGGVSAGLVNPGDAGTGAVVGAALPPGINALGWLGGKTADALHSSANRLMQSAIKPTLKELKTGDASIAVQTLLDNGLSPNAKGVEKLREIIGGLNDEISNKIANSNALIDKAQVANALGGVRQRFANQVSPTADLNAISGVADDFMNHPSFPGASLPIQAAQELKQGTYRTLAKKYGQMGSAEVEAQKGLARGLKDEIANAIPEIQGLNAQESKLITTLNVTERRALMELNKNPMGLAALATNPASWAAFMADRSSAFKALAARMVNASVNKAQSAAPMLERTASSPFLRSAPAIAVSGE